jgi:hypothetical protein
MKQSVKLKNAKYDKWFNIIFRFNLLTYILCKPDDVATFVALEETSSLDIPKLNIFKFDTEEEATALMKSIPDFEMMNEPILLEVVPNTFIAELL